MYRANLSHQQLTKFLELLLNYHLLTRDQHLFVTTARGRAFTETFHEIQAILGETSETHVSSFAN